MLQVHCKRPEVRLWLFRGQASKGAFRTDRTRVSPRNWQELVFFYEFARLYQICGWRSVMDPSERYSSCWWHCYYRSRCRCSQHKAEPCIRWVSMKVGFYYRYTSLKSKCNFIQQEFLSSFSILHAIKITSISPLAWLSALQHPCYALWYRRCVKNLLHRFLNSALHDNFLSCNISSFSRCYRSRLI